jgi:molybdate transport system substrate-binding protein
MASDSHFLLRRPVRPVRRAVVAWLLGLAFLASTSVVAADVTVAVAANFAAPMARIAERFTAATGHAVKVSVGSTGRLYSQIVAGAPFELLLAADAERPARLVAEGRARAENRFTYAIGQLGLWSPQPGLVAEGGAVLGSDRFRRLALANPKLAPYGAAAMAVLRARGLDQALAPRIVMGDSIAQVYQFVATGNAELGFVSLSQVAVPGQPVAGSLWRVPQALYPQIRQDVVLLTAGEANPAAVQLLRYLKSPETRALIKGFGYALDD